MTDKLRAAAQAALEALKCAAQNDVSDCEDAIEQLRAALAEPEGGLCLTIVYRDVQPGPECTELCRHPKVSAVSWSHAIDDRNAARAALAETEPCWCDRQQIGEPGVSCGDCPTRDYQLRDATKMIEPVAWMDREGHIYPMPEKPGWAPPHTFLYTTPPRREWQSLTDEERLDAFDDYLARTSDGRHLFRHSWSYAEEEREAFDAGVAVAEAKLKDKNHDSR